MKNPERLTAKNVRTHLDVADVNDLLRKLADMSAGFPSVFHVGLTADDIDNALRQREAQFSTALGNGMMMPHARFADLTSELVLLVTLARPLPLPTPDGKPVKVVCMVLIPEAHPMRGLKIISGLARLLRDPEITARLAMQETPEQVMECLQTMDYQPPEALTAEEIMRPCSLSALPDCSLKQLTRTMAEQHIESVPVLTRDDVMVGEVTCAELFKIGIPDFFSQLRSVGFIRYFDPFDQYFEMESGATAGEVMSRKYRSLTPDATMIEVVFAISVQKYRQLYVLSAEGKLLGVIDQASLLERIINL